LLRNNRGFSLLELLISISILAVGITVILQALSFSAHAASVCQAMTRGVFLAKDKLQELEYKKRSNLLKYESLDYAESTQGYDYACTLTPITDREDYLLHAEISVKRAKRRESITIDSRL
jgi:prepilin-type N-terminal cleavage/methylation domain-containing protein